MDTLNCFANYAKGANTPQKLYEAIEKLGPLPRVVFVGTGSKRPSGDLTTNKDDTKDKESAEDEAKAVYEFARRIAIGLLKANPDFPKLRPTETDPFLGLQTIQEWCIEAQKVVNKPNGKSRKIFGDKFEVWGLSINYKNSWHKIKNWPCVVRGIKKIRKLFRR